MYVHMQSSYTQWRGIMFSRWTSVCLSVCVSFPDDNLSKHQWIFTKLGMCTDIMEVSFEIADEQISSNFDGVICPRHAQFSFPDDNLSKL